MKTNVDNFSFYLSNEILLEPFDINKKKVTEVK